MDNYLVNVVSTSLEVYAAAILIAIMLCYMLKTVYSEKINQYFMGILVTQIVMNLVDSVTYVINREYVVLWCIMYTLTAFQVIFFHGYFVTKMRLYINVASLVVQVPFLLITITIVAYWCSYFTGWFYHIVDGQPVENPNYWMVEIVLILGLFFDIIFAVRWRKTIGITKMMTWILYIIFPAVSLFFIDKWNESVVFLSMNISIIMIYLNITIEDEMAKLHYEEELNKSQKMLLLSQIHPHFIFNTLSSMKQLCKDEQLADLIMDFSSYLRMNIDTMTNDECIPFEKEVEHTKAYLRIEQIRFGRRLSVFYNFESVDFEIPPLTLQPLVENAVVHGVCQKRGGGKVIIGSIDRKSYYEIIIEDDGVGFDPDSFGEDSQVHVGMENVKQRLKMMCGGKLEIASEKGKGTVITIKVPKQRNVDKSGRK